MYEAGIAVLEITKIDCCFASEMLQVGGESTSRLYSIQKNKTPHLISF
jgi:hypothetical protein